MIGQGILSTRSMARQDGLVVAGSRFCRSTYQLFVVLVFLSSPAFSQAPSPAALPSQTAQTAAPAPGGATSDRDISLRGLPKNFLADQKYILLFPTQLGKRKHWIPTIAIVGVSASLIATDPHTAPTFRTGSDFGSFNRSFSLDVLSSHLTIGQA